MPRRNREKRERPREPHLKATTSPIPAPPGWQAEEYRGGLQDHDYVCPRCEHRVNRRSQHVVAWRTDDDERHRHWHTACWQAAVREGIDRYRWL